MSRVPFAIMTFVATAMLATTAATASEEPAKIDPAKVTSFNTTLFAKPPAAKGLTYACFTRRYDADHLARHPKQKVAAMKLLVTFGHPPEESSTPYSFRLGFKYRHRKGDWDSSGACHTLQSKETDGEVRLGCSVDCDGGGIEIGLGKTTYATRVRLERVRIWQNNKPDDDGEELSAGADDKIFRLDRTNIKDCEALITDRKELAALRSKRP
jgi:hypothetical protein